MGIYHRYLFECFEIILFFDDNLYIRADQFSFNNLNSNNETHFSPGTTYFEFINKF